MSQEQLRDDASTIVRLAAIAVTAERLPGLAAGLAGTRTVAAALAKYDYGLIEPASRFATPAGSGQGPDPRRRKK